MMLGLAVAALWGGLAGLVLGVVLGEFGARASALIDAGRALRRLARERLVAGEWQASGALREGAVLVELLDDPPARVGDGPAAAGGSS